MLFEYSFVIGRIFDIRGARQVLVKLVLFQLRVCGHPQDNDLPNFFPDSKSSVLGLSKMVSFISEFFFYGGKNS